MPGQWAIYVATWLLYREAMGSWSVRDDFTKKDKQDKHPIQARALCAPLEPWQWRRLSTAPARLNIAKLEAPLGFPPVKRKSSRDLFRGETCDYASP